MVNDEQLPSGPRNRSSLAAPACGLLAYQRRTELWASLASLLMMLAGTILVLHFEHENPNLWLVAIQANAAMLGAMSLARLGLHRLLAPADVEVARLQQLPGAGGARHRRQRVASVLPLDVARL